MLHFFIQILLVNTVDHMILYAMSVDISHFNVQNSIPLNDQQFISQPSFLNYIQQCPQQYSIESYQPYNLFQPYSLPYFWPCFTQQQQQQQQPGVIIPYTQQTPQSKSFVV